LTGWLGRVRLAAALDALSAPALPTGRRLALIGLAASLAGCTVFTDSDHDSADAPSTRPPPQVPRTAWVFSSGGPRGFVHVGVLKALEELGLVPDLMVGASVGALVAVLAGGGMPAKKIEHLALDLQPWQLARLAVTGAEKLSGAALADFVRSHSPEPLLERLRVPVACAAKRLSDNSVVAFNCGDVGLAVQAAAAIEGQFVPVRIRGQRHVDADLLMPLPVRLARSLGAVRVLAVDASAHEEKAPNGAERYRSSDQLKRRLTQPDAALADVLLHPEFGYWVRPTREYREQAIEAGYRATLAAAPALRAMHAG
jgi:NTE family protein